MISNFGTVPTSLDITIALVGIGMISYDSKFSIRHKMIMILKYINGEKSCEVQMAIKIPKTSMS